MDDMESRGDNMTEGKETAGRADRQSGTAVPESEISIDFARSSGPGGQNVNKRATKAVLSWDIGASGAFDERQKALRNRIELIDHRDYE